MKAHLLLIAVGALTGCALLGKSAPVVPHFYTPEYEGGAARPEAAPSFQLRLGRVEGRSHLRERLVVRSAGQEIVYDEERRWTERPDVFLRHALERNLFEERGLVAVHSGRAITLDVELIAFEELAEPHQVRLQARLTLVDGRLGLLDETVTVDQAVAAADGPDRTHVLVDAFSQALRAGVTRMSDEVVKTLAQESARAGR